MSAADEQRWRPRPSCGPESALTVAGLRTHWAELGEYAPILVVRGPTDAHWAQHADVLVAEGGLIVARLFAPYAKQSQPAPGVVWPRAAATDAPICPPPEPI
jgi:hypothetical protein